MDDNLPVITRSTNSSDRTHPANGAMTRINRSGDLVAGSYWRAKDDVPELTKPQRRERGIYLPEDHPDHIATKVGWRQEEVNRIGTEDYMVDVPIRSGMPAGRMHLVRSLKTVDREIHAVVLQAHPSEGDRAVDRTYLVDEFLRFFELVPEEEAQAIRQSEIAALQDEIGDLQRAMIAGPPAEAGVPLLGHRISLPASPSIGTMVANIDHVETLQAGAERALALATAHTGWIQTHTKLIGERTAAMVPFYQERAAAALASTEKIMRYADDLQKGVQSLGLYTGTGVEVRRLAEGESADRSEPLHVHREMLFMDEEYLANLDQEGNAGGADHQDFDDFVERLKSDPTLRDRILPFPRMVVLMRYRRSSRIYIQSASIEAAIANAEWNKPNRIQFLLIRDGGNLWQVHSDLTTQAIPALYPTKGMGDAPFQGVDGANILPEDLKFSEARERFDDLNRVYRNLLLMMWGLNDRLKLFGDFYDASDWTTSGFLDEGFQHRRMRFRDPESEASLGTGRPRFVRWVAEMNGWLRSGSRVLVMRQTLSTSGALGRGNEMEERQPAALRTIGSAALEMVVRRSAGRHVVEVQAGRQVHPRDRFRQSYYASQTSEVPLDETDGGWSERGTLRWLCLDMVRSSDIDHYLQSRADRRYYMGFYALLLAVRDQLRLEEPLLEPLLKRLESAYAEAPVPLPEGMTAGDLARQAVRLWRTANRGAMPPHLRSEEHADAYRTMLDGMWTLAGNDHPITEAEAAAASEGREPLRLVLVGGDRFALYATSVGDEIEDRLFDHVWVTRLSCQRRKNGFKVTSRRVLPMPAAVADEEILHEWDALSAWAGRDVSPIVNRPHYSGEIQDPVTHETIRKAFATIAQGSLEAFRTEPESLAEALGELGRIRKKMTKTRSVAQMHHVQPFAVIRTTEIDRKPVEGFTSRYEEEIHDRDYLVLALQDDPYRMLHRLCRTDGERRMVRDAFASQYADKVYQASSFEQDAAKPPKIGVRRLTDWAKGPPDPLRRTPSWDTIPLEANWSESIRSFDMQERGYGEGLWIPTTDRLVAWIDPAAPEILNDLCRRFDLTAVPFVPKRSRR